MPAASRRPEHYNVLGLVVDATDEDIRAAYKKLALQWHPDRHQIGKEHAAQMFVEVNAAYHSLMDGTESVDPSCGDSVSPFSTPTESDTARTYSAEPRPQANAQPSHRTTSSGSQKNEQTPNLFSTSVPGSDAEKLSQSRSSDDNTAHYASHDHHSNPKNYSCSTGSNGSRSRSRTKSYDNLRDLPRPSAHDQAPSSASRSHSSRTSNVPHSKSHDNLRDSSRSREPQSGQTPPSVPRDPKSETSNRSKNNQGAGPTSTYSKGRPRDAKPLRSQTGHFSQPVIPPTSSKLHKFSRRGLGEELLHKLSKGSSKFKKEGGSTYSDNAPTYGSPLRPLGAPRGTSKEWLFPLPLTLDEMYYGTTYQFLITRELLSRKTEQVEIYIDVPPGIRSGTRIICPRTGHQRKDGTLQDVIFLIEQVPHGGITRMKDDLFMDICVPWVETLAERGANICVDGMDGEEIIFALPYPIYDKSTEGQLLVKGAGMPIREGRKTVGRGDLIVRWQVVFSHPSKWENFKKALRMKA
ncbi:DnaJ domain-containing protein [Suillus clintonianus]|uniref:DnaJ domain-containing protein n=1 Tax=Suillus clintonianus TaxID=1904413 RepID=UPI001B86980C|nr:DnaJ domain-containing protein [Suillus clintonianus]KAG2154025.1 DnaJ domain-containing protein [Suillus clintonianus]